MTKRLKYTFYVAQAIEYLGDDVDQRKWLEPIRELGSYPDIGCYDPVEREAQKSGQACGNTGKYITGLKQAGHWDKFDHVMDRIWWGDIEPGSNKMRLMLALRDEFAINGNTMADLNYWADYEAVCRSNFIFAYIEKNVKTVGTYCEIEVAYLLGVPVYLIIPDQTTRDANSSLIYRIRKSGGEVFYSSKDAVKFVKEKYKL